MIRPIIAVVVLLFSDVALAQNTPNPLYSAWMKFKPGATATYSGESRTLGIEATIETSIKLVSVASDKVTIEVRRKVTSGSDTVEELAKTETIQALLPAGITMVADPDEQIEVNGKSYKCKVFRAQQVESADGKKVDLGLVSRTWLSEEVPGGIVRVDARTEGAIGLSTSLTLKSMSTP
jgi:hypothetical protein